MSTNLSFGSIHLDVAAGHSPERRQREPERPFVIAIAADFSGRQGRGIREPVELRQPRWIDMDNFDAVMRKLEVGVSFAPSPERPGPQILKLESRDAFHPDQLLRTIPTLARLLEQRQSATSSIGTMATSGEATALMTTAPGAATKPHRTPAPAESDSDVFARLLGRVPATPAPPAAPRTTAMEKLIQNIVRPSLVADTGTQQTAVRSALDLELSAELNRLLHDPAFQSVESAWRGVELLVRDYGAEENVKFVLLDISYEELASDLMKSQALETTGIAKLLRRQADGKPWAVWLGLYAFGASVDELQILGRLAKLSAHAGVPFITGGKPQILGTESLAAHPDPDDWEAPVPADLSAGWKALRSLPEAAYVGVALPRFLLRQPYGKTSDPIEAFPFEEIPAPQRHEDYLWGNPSLACGHLLAGAFLADGWELQAGGYGEMSELPLHQFQEEGEIRVKPCAEAWLSERAGDRMLDLGLMPVLSLKGRDAIRLANIQSLAGSALPVGS